MNDDRIARLERLARLRDEGVLSQDEFDIEKARVLGEADQAAPPDSIPASIGARASTPTNGWLLAGIGALVLIATALVAVMMWDRRDGEGSSPTPEGSQAPVATGSPVSDRTAADVVSPAQPKAISPTSSRAPVAPKITGEWRNFRTRIREGWGTEPDFAGRYVIIRIGCGAGCTFGIVGDHQTGELHDLGLGGEEQMYLDLRYGNDSDLIRARWDDYENCTEQLFTWTGAGVRPLGEPEVRPRGEEPCDMSY